MSKQRLDSTELNTLLNNFYQNPENISFHSEKLAEFILNEAELSFYESCKEKGLYRLIKEPQKRYFIVEFIDHFFHSRPYRSKIKQLSQLIQDRFGHINFYLLEKTILKSWLFLAFVSPKLVHAVTEYCLYFFLQDVLFFAKSLQKKLLKSQQRSEKLIVNILGEKALCKADVQHMKKIYLKLIELPHLDAFSIKISSIHYPIDPLNFLACQKEIIQSLEDLLTHIHKKKKEPILLYLDMEQIDHLELSLTVLKTISKNPSFFHIPLGIVLQCYLPQCQKLLSRVIETSKDRVSQGACPIRVRLVKGANLSEEKIICDKSYWAPRTFENKSYTDAQYKHCIRMALKNADIIQLSVGSHNLFDLSYAILLAHHYKATDSFRIELLAGMAKSIYRALQKHFPFVWLYCPVANRKHVQDSIPYLLRRLDENSQSQHFLSGIYTLTVNNRHWKKQLAAFQNSLKIDPEASTEMIASRSIYPKTFKNSALSEYSKQEIRTKIFQEIHSYSLPEAIPFILNGESIYTDCLSLTKNKNLYENCLQFLQNIRVLSPKKRIEILYKTAKILQDNKNKLIAILVKSIHKNISEADAEVCEAIDFCHYYANNYKQYLDTEAVKFEPKGPCLICPPWNFPIAITTGMLAANVVAGNPILLKATPYAIVANHFICDCFQKAGLPSDSIHFVHGEDSKIGQKLLEDKRFKLIMMTGSTQSSRWMQKTRPDIDIIAETGGKNSMIVTEHADIDLAIADTLKSAFSFSGQKCSAASLLIVTENLVRHSPFLERLKAAASDLVVGNASNPATDIGPIITENNDRLIRALNTLEEGEGWLLEPQKVTEKLYSPGIKLGIQAYSYFHMTECFGPVLGIMIAKDLSVAIEWANAPEYGLSAALHSLSKEEQRLYKNKIAAGNIYLNRESTGAIVELQPFGGIKGSSMGPGYKAGGPWFILGAAHLTHKRNLKKAQKNLLAFFQPQLEKLSLNASAKLFLNQAANNYRNWGKETLHLCKTTQTKAGEYNQLLLKPKPGLHILIAKEALMIDVLTSYAFIYFLKITVPICIAYEHPHRSLILELFKAYEILSETEFVKALESQQYGQIRVLGKASEKIVQLANQNHHYIAKDPVLASAFLEARHYFQEYTVSERTHRHGYLLPNTTRVQKDIKAEQLSL